MRNTHRCPKCGGTDIITADQGRYNAISIGILALSKLERWVCCTCGYSEEWVKQDDLDKVRKFYREESGSERKDG